MNFLLLQLLAATAAGGIYQNIDNFALAAAYRIKNVVIPWRANMLIAVFSGAASGGAVAQGFLLEEKARNYVGDALKAVGCGILIMVGVWILAGYFRSRLFPRLGAPASDDGEAKLPGNIGARDEPTSMSNREALVAAIALAADNLAPSFLGGLSGTLDVNPAAGVLLAVLTWLCSIVAVAKGQAIGRMGHSGLRNIAPDLVSGCMVICIAFLGLADDSNPLNPEKWFGASLRPAIGHAPTSRDPEGFKARRGPYPVL
jgi:putative Mn2+ efflux pump MntP